MSFVAKNFRLEAYFLFLLYASSIWCLISTTLQSTNMTLDCSKEIILTSPGYPSDYQNGVSKEWYITAPSERRVLVTFNDFSLELDEDSLWVRDNVNTDTRRRYTGEDVHFPPFLTQGYSLHIEFTSSNKGKRQGFNISVSCFHEASARAYSGRLMDGTSPAEGFLELLSSPSGMSGEWKRVCEENLPRIVADIICRELGSSGVNKISYYNSSCLLGENCTKAPVCQENAYRLVDCAHVHTVCSSNKSVKIKCREVGYKGCYDLGSQTLENGSPFKSKEQCISSCRKDIIQAIAIMNHADCFCSTVDEIQLADKTRKSDTEHAECTAISASTMSVYSASVGLCDILADTGGGSWDSNTTRFGSIVHLTCMDGYSLNGSGALQCMPTSSPLYPVWNDSIPSCVMNDTYRLKDCTPVYSTSSTDKAVKIKCFEPGYKGCYEFEMIQPQNCFPFESTAQCVSSCKTDEFQAIAGISHVECFCTTASEPL